MGTNEFLEICINKIIKDYNSMEDKQREITKNDVYKVWNCKTLQNNKALLSTAVSGDGIYYEMTYNGDKNELYMDRYKKELNKCIKL